MKHLLFFGIAFAAFHFSHSNVPAFCTLPHDEGEGTMFNFAVYYDEASDRCSPFIYKGQGGNNNRFESERECIRNCSANVDSIYPIDASKGCLIRKSKGHCNGEYLRYYYDYVHRKCKKFHWSGCMGNGNRFFSYDSCNSTCSGIHTDDGEDEMEEDEPDTPIAIICGVLLAVIVVIILITVIVLTVMSKKKSSKKKAPGKSKDAKAESPLQEPGIEMA